MSHTTRTPDRRRTLRLTAVSALAALVATTGVLAAVPAASAADTTLVSTATTTWSYLDDNTDPAAGLADRTAWTAEGFSTAAWKTGKGAFGAKRGSATSGTATEVGGTSYPVTTLLNQYIDGSSTPDVPAFFFRTPLSITQAQLDSWSTVTASLKYDDAVTVYVNGTRVAGFDDGSITANLQYGGSNADQPKSETFTIPTSALHAGTNTLAVEVHQGRQDSSDIYLDFTSLVAATAAPKAVVSDVVLNVGSDPSQRGVAWYSSQAATQQVQVAKKDDVVGGAFPADAASFTATSGQATDGQFYQHATITGLVEDTTYAYRVGDATNGWSPAYEFSTRKFSGDYSFLFVGDPQIGASGNVANDQNGWVATMSTAVAKFPRSEFLFSAGDQVNTASNENEYAAYLAPEQLRTLPSATLDGNHDVGSKAYEQHFTMPNWDPTYGAASSPTSSGGDYWFTYNGVLFISLDSNAWQNDNHEEFIQKVVAEHGADARWKVVAFHHSIYSVAAHTNDADIVDRRSKLPTILSRYGIDMVLMGHDHSYTRSWLINKGEVAEVGGVAQPTVTAEPGDVLYVTANSASGSKYYDVKAPDAPFAAVINQEKKRNYSNVEVTDRSITVTTYRSEDNTVVDAVTLERADHDAPTLTTPGDASVGFGAGFDALAGVSATDATDGNLTSHVTVSGHVDTSVLGPVTLTYTVSDAAGNTATATRTVTVVPAAFVTRAPEIAGTARVGSTLTAAPSVWVPAATTVTYQWLRGGAPIAGATTARYTPVAADAGTRISVRVTGARTGYTTATVVSTAVTVATGVLTPAVPKIKGKAKAGKKLTVKVGRWSPKASLSYRWFAGNKVVKGGTKATLKLTKKLAKKLKGKKLTVRVTGTAAGYATATVTSKATAKVKAKKATAKGKGKKAGSKR